ncbi:MAG TPA: PP2C family protein-serine/threonine phosphatase, partial [bacterium]|nr:PP2C family protein-serine/threonine phosphatase [bacterium]
FLGALKNLEYESNVVMLQPGETLFLITDGITEAMNPGEEMFGDKRTEESLQSHAGESLNNLVENMIKEVQAFAGAQEQSDDMTCLTLRYFGR